MAKAKRRESRGRGSQRRGPEHKALPPWGPQSGSAAVGVLAGGAEAQALRAQTIRICM